MRILFTNTGSWGTGSFTVINAVVKEFIKLGHDVKVFFPDSKRGVDDEKKYYNNDLYEIWKFPIKKGKVRIPTFPLMIPDPHPRNPNPCIFKGLSKAQLKLYFDIFEERIKKTIAAFKPDIVECQHIWAMGHIISKLWHPYVITAHHSDQIAYRFDSNMRKIAYDLANDAPYIFTVSDYVKQEVLRLYNVSSSKVIVLPNGYDKEVCKRMKLNRQTVLKELGVKIPSKMSIVTFAGKISKTKGIDILLKASELLKNKDVHFLIFGAGDIKTIFSPAQINKYCNENVHLLGHRSYSELTKAHNIAKLSVMPSRSEGFGIAALEAMGCGLPIVVTQDGGQNSFAVGETVEKDNAEQLAEAIMKIINLPEDQYKALSVKALETAQTFSWETNAKSRLGYYQKVIE